MKKIIFSAAIAAAITTAGYLGLRTGNSNSEQISDIMMANIEALADGEIEANCTFSKVEADQEKNKLNCSGSGTLCCRFP